MRRLTASLAALLLAGALLPASVAADGGWTVSVTSGDRLAATLISDSAANPAFLALHNKTRLTSPDPMTEWVLELLNLGGYSQLATWHSAGGPRLACPPDANPLCVPGDAGGAVLVPGSLRALLSASATASGSTTLSAKPTRESLAFDITIAAVGLAIAALVNDPGFVNPDLVVALAWQLHAEAHGALDALLAGDLVAAADQLRALAFTAVHQIAEHAVEWAAALGLGAAVGLLTSFHPLLLLAKLAVPATKAAIALVHLVSARNDPPTVAALSWGGGVAAGTATTQTVGPKCGLVVAQWATFDGLVRSLPQSFAGNTLTFSSGNTDTNSNFAGDLRSVGLANAQSDNTMYVSAFPPFGDAVVWAIRVAGACDHDLLDAVTSLVVTSLSRSPTQSADPQPSVHERWEAIAGRPYLVLEVGVEARLLMPVGDVVLMVNGDDDAARAYLASVQYEPPDAHVPSVAPPRQPRQPSSRPSPATPVDYSVTPRFPATLALRPTLPATAPLPGSLSAYGPRQESTSRSSCGMRTAPTKLCGRG